jgi:hypothetical protein
MRAVLLDLRGAMVAIAAALVAIAAAPALPSCGDSFEPPCNVAGRKVIVDTASAIRLGPIAVAEGQNGDLVFTWLESDTRRADGGAGDAGPSEGPDDGGDGGDGGASGVATFVAPQASVLVVSRDGTEKLRHVFAPPAALAARRGGTGSVGVTFIGDAVLFRWVETTVTTLPEGTQLTSAALKLQRVQLDGTEGPPVADPELACTHCGIVTAFASIGATAAAIVVMIRPELSINSALARASTPRLTTFTSEGRRLAAIDLTPTEPAPLVDASASSGVGGLGSAQAQQLGSLTLDVRDGAFVARVGRTSFVVDTSLARRAGPYTTPTASTALDVDLPSGDITLSWIGAPSGATAGSSTQTAVGGSPDLFFQTRAASGAPPASPHRISSSFRALDIRRNQGRTGVIHSSGVAEWFVLVDADGKKIGGDHALSAGQGASIDETRQLLGFSAATLTETASLDSLPRTRLLTTDGAGRYVVWSTTSEVVREEVVCAP